MDTLSPTLGVPGGGVVYVNPRQTIGLHRCFDSVCDFIPRYGREGPSLRKGPAGSRTEFRMGAAD